MSRLKVAIIRGDCLNPWEMQNFSPLAKMGGDVIDIIACGAIDAGYPVENIELAIEKFPLRTTRFERWGRAARLMEKLGLVRRPAHELVGLGDFLRDYDIAHSAETHLPISEQAVKSGCRKVVLTCWETIPHAYEEIDGIAERRRIVRPKVDLFLPTTPRAARALEIEGVAPDKIRMLMPGVDVHRFTPASRSKKMCEELAVSEDDILFLFIGRLILEKGVRELVIAFDDMLSRLPETVADRCKLRIAGEGPMKKRIQEWISNRKLDDKAAIVSGRDYSQLNELHQSADIFVLPSVPAPYWEEQFGMVLIEAMACGKPVISTSSGAIPEVVGCAAILVPPMEPLALSQAMAELAENGQKRTELGKQARQRAVEQFDSEQFARQLLCLYQKLAQ